MTVGLLDTSVVIDLEQHITKLPESLRVSAVTLAELAVGVRTAPATERAARAARLDLIRSQFDPIPFGDDQAVQYGLIVAKVRSLGRKERPRMAGLLIAATAAASQLTLYTLNGKDVDGLDPFVEVVTL